MLKESKIRVLENFYAIDYTLFGKPVKESKVCCPFFVEEYLSTKGALVSALVEMYKLIGHTPTNIPKVLNEGELIKMAKKTAKIAKENAKLNLSSDAGRASVKKSIRESLASSKGKKINIESEVQRELRKRAFALALDSMLVNRVLKESKSVKKLNEWEGKVIKEAYITLRNALIESALAILEN